VRLRKCGRPNGEEVNPRGQGPRGYGSAARRMPAFEARDACGVTPFKNTAERAGSAGGPKPGRAGFYLELGRRKLFNNVIRRWQIRAPSTNAIACQALAMSLVDAVYRQAISARREI